MDPIEFFYDLFLDASDSEIQEIRILLTDPVTNEIDRNKVNFIMPKIDKIISDKRIDLIKNLLNDFSPKDVDWDHLDEIHSWTNNDLHQAIGEIAVDLNMPKDKLIPLFVNVNSGTLDPFKIIFIGEMHLENDDDFQIKLTSDDIKEILKEYKPTMAVNASITHINFFNFNNFDSQNDGSKSAFVPRK